MAMKTHGDEIPVLALLARKPGHYHILIQMAGHSDRKWTPEERLFLRLTYACGSPLKEVETGLEDRTVKDISKKAKRMGLVWGGGWATYNPIDE